MYKYRDIKYFDKPNASNISFEDFYKRLKLEKYLLKANILYVHFVRSNMTLEEWLVN